jgi:hypothetical protein
MVPCGGRVSRSVRLASCALLGDEAELHEPPTYCCSCTCAPCIHSSVAKLSCEELAGIDVLQAALPARPVRIRRARVVSEAATCGNKAVVQRCDGPRATTDRACAFAGIREENQELTCTRHGAVTIRACVRARMHGALMRSTHPRETPGRARAAWSRRRAGCRARSLVGRSLYGIVREPNLVNEVNGIISEVMGNPGYSHAQKMTLLRDASDRMWKRLNSPAIASVYYKLSDRANLNSARARQEKSGCPSRPDQKVGGRAAAGRSVAMVVTTSLRQDPTPWRMGKEALPRASTVGRAEQFRKPSDE